jgi:hypothetical protein
MPYSGVSAKELVQPNTGVSLESAYYDQGTLEWKLPDLRRLIDQTNIAQSNVDAAATNKKDLQAHERTFAAKMAASSEDLKIIAFEGETEAFMNPAADEMSLADRSEKRLSLYHFRSRTHDRLLKLIEEANITELEKIVDLKVLEYQQFTLAAEVAQLRLNVSLIPALSTGDILAAPLSANLLALEDDARQAEYSLQASRTALANARGAYQQIAQALMSGPVRRPIYS